MIYNFSVVTAGIDLDSDTLTTLAAHPNIVGTKLSCGNVGKLTHLTSSFRKSEFAVFPGTSDVFVPSLLVGGAGVIGASVNILPKVHAEVYRLWREGKTDEALKLQYLLAHGDWAVKRIGGIAALKAIIVKEFGCGSGRVRGPLVPVSAEKVDALQQTRLPELLALEKSLYYGDHSSSSDYVHQSPDIAPERSTILPTSKKRRSPNAFILFRSHFIATGQVPPGMVHQNDVSRHVAEVWKSQLTPSDRAVFFKKAQEEKVRFDVEGPKVPAKKRRSRAKKTCQSSLPKSTALPYLPRSLTSPVDTVFDATDMSPSTSSAMHLSPQSCSSPTIYTPVTPSDASVPFPAPQSMYAIPPDLFNWDFPVDNNTMSTDKLGLPMFFNAEPATACPATGYYFDDSVPLTGLDFNALQLDFTFPMSGLNMSFLDPESSNFLFPSSFENPFYNSACDPRA
ncbi:aldolase [Fomitiporia mediterranea MF3/22]|uniref:aldolase n=1 Tax=Fomitiporia mediterranea (strain MF3/22) TaxID=694068 RepID=UPI00044093E4|nr:aldolase [Fomitiporia mediterranea MF3/22]EJD06802.1 aldolase [Fomitiporia mediterranea MF3/22]